MKKKKKNPPSLEWLNKDFNRYFTHVCASWWLSKESACNVGDLDSIPGLGRSLGEGNDNPLQYSCLEKSHEQRSLAGYSLWGCKELDTTERLTRTFIYM